MATTDNKGPQRVIPGQVESQWVTWCVTQGHCRPQGRHIRSQRVTGASHQVTAGNTRSAGSRQVTADHLSITAGHNGSQGASHKVTGVTPVIRCHNRSQPFIGGVTVGHRDHKGSHQVQVTLVSHKVTLVSHQNTTSHRRGHNRSHSPYAGSGSEHGRRARQSCPQPP